MFKTHRVLQTGHIGLLSGVLLLSSATAYAQTTTLFQTNDSHRVPDPSVQTNSPTVTRMEYVPHGITAPVEVTPKPRISQPASRSRSLVPKSGSLNLRWHQIYHTSDCPPGPQWVVDLAHSMVASRFGEAQWPYAKRLWTKESNFNPWCENSIGAYGVPQAYPGSKMGGDWRFDVRHQIEWGDSYIASRYGTPERAMANSDRFNSY